MMIVFLLPRPVPMSILFWSIKLSSRMEPFVLKLPEIKMYMNVFIMVSRRRKISKSLEGSSYQI